MADEKNTAAQPSPQLRATVENRAEKPAGLLPKNTQQLVILGVAVVMVLIMWLTGSGKRKPTAAAPVSAPGTRVQPPNAATVEDFKQTIQQEQAETRQPISPSNLARLKALGLAGDVPPNAVSTPPEATIPEPGGVVGGGMVTQQPPPPPDPVKEDKK